MGFQILVNGESASELDVDPHLVKSLTIGSDRIPVQFAQDSVNIEVNLGSELDAEYLEHIARALLAEEQEEKAKAEAKEAKEAEKAEKKENGKKEEKVVHKAKGK